MMQLARMILTLLIYLLAGLLANYWYGWKLVLILLLVLWAHNIEEKIKRDEEKQ